MLFIEGFDVMIDPTNVPTTVIDENSDNNDNDESDDDTDD